MVQRRLSSQASFIGRIRAESKAKESKGIASKVGAKNKREAFFVLILGLMLSFNSGYINGICLSGLVGRNPQSVSAVTATYTRSGLDLASGNLMLFGLEVAVILSFIGGAIVSGALNPQAIPHKLVPTYGPIFLIGSICMYVSAILGVMLPDRNALYYFAAMANGLQNGATSTYSANLIRTSHLTGTSTDIGLIVGQMLRGNMKNYWKFKVLVGLALSFWLGGLLSFYSSEHFLLHSLWFSAALYSIVGVTHVVYVVFTERVGLIQAVLGTWTWDKVVRKMARSINAGSGMELGGGMTAEQIDHIFMTIDADQSGDIDEFELRDALEQMGMEASEKCVANMMKVVDENGDGVIDRLEFHALVNIALEREKFKKAKKDKKFLSVSSLKVNVGARPTNSFREREDEEASPQLSESNRNALLHVVEEETKFEGTLESQAGNYADSSAIVANVAQHPLSGEDSKKNIVVP